MKYFLLFILSVSTANLFAQSPIQAAIDAFTNDAFFKNASISFMAVDCKTGEVLGSKNPHLSISPASTTKLFSTATAFEFLGKDYQPSTRIYIDGTITKDSILKGNLWIRGGGDVSLGSRYYNGDGKENDFFYAWTDSLKAKGIKRIEGIVITDASEFGYEAIPDGWAWGDIGNYYGAGPSGLPIYDNMLRYYFRTGKSAGQATQLIETFPVIQNLSFHNYITSGGSGDNSYIYGAPYSYDRFGTGTLGAGAGRFTVKGSIPDPELQFAQEFSRILKEKGMMKIDSCTSARNLAKESPSVRYPSKKLIFTYKGKSLSSVAWWTNMKSVNLFAEEVLCWVGYHESGNGSTEKSLSILSNFWGNKFNTSGFYMNDGSGLSHNNAISSFHFCELLKYMNTSKNKEAFYSTLPVAGISGTVSSVCSNQAGEGRLHMKSGTLKRVKAYAGYVESKSGKKIAFAIIVNNFNCSSDTTVGKMEKVFNVMAIQ